MIQVRTRWPTQTTGTASTAPPCRSSRSTSRTTTGLFGKPKRSKSACAPSNTFDGWPMETPLPPDFKEFLRLLNSETIEYLGVGGYAVSYHGYPRPTEGP